MAAERATNVSRKAAAPASGKESRSSDSAVANPKTGRMKRPKANTGKKKAVPREQEQQLEAITPFKRGVPIGVKFGAAVIAVIVLFTGLLGYLTYTIAERELSEQILEQGISAANALEKAVDRSLWFQKPEAQIQNPKTGETIYLEGVPYDQLIEDWEGRLKRLVDGSGGKIVYAGLIMFDASGGQKATLHTEQVRIGGSNLIHEERDANNQVVLRVTESKLLDKNLLMRRFDRKIDLSSPREEKIAALVKKAVEAGDDDLEKRADLESAVKELHELTGRKDLATAAEWKGWYDENRLRPRQDWINAGQNPPWVSLFVQAGRLDELRDGLWKRIAAVTGCGALAAILFTVVITALLTGPIREIEQDVAEVARGNFEHQTGVKAKDEIGALAHVFNIMVRNLRIAQTNLVARQSFERELSIAKEIQEKLLPERIPQIPGYDIHNYYRSAKEVGGDYYDFIVIDQTHLGIIVADVAGKGVPGAMVMTMARSLVRLASVRNVSPADTFKKVNRILAKDIRRGMFVTSAYLVLNVKTRQLKIASAGHNPVVLWRAAKGENELLKPAGIALGFDKGTVFDNNVKEVEVQLEPGDRVVVYTDGVNEAMNDDSEEFGEERFFDLVKQHGAKNSQEFVKAVISELDKHRANAEQSDDITMVTLGVSANAGQGVATVSVPVEGDA